MSHAEAWLIASAAALAIWLLRAIFVPHAVCRWCHGTGNNPFSNRSRQGDCWVCHGDRRRMTWLARKIRRL